MRPIRSLAYTVTAAALAMSIAGCNSDVFPTGPSVAPTEASQGVVSDLLSAVTKTLVSVVKRPNSLAQDVIVTAQIGAAGGTIRIPAAGFELVVPRGAVSQTTTFQVKALAGNLIAYEFQPHGAKFAVPLKFSQVLPGLDLLSLLSGSTPQLGYFASPTQIDNSTGTAVVSELAPAIVVTDLLGKKAVGNIYHFSGYLVSSGRSTSR